MTHSATHTALTGRKDGASLLQPKPSGVIGARLCPNRQLSVARSVTHGYRSALLRCGLARLAFRAAEHRQRHGVDH